MNKLVAILFCFFLFTSGAAAQTYKYTGLLPLAALQGDIPSQYYPASKSFRLKLVKSGRRYRLTIPGYVNSNMVQINRNTWSSVSGVDSAVVEGVTCYAYYEAIISGLGLRRANFAMAVNIAFENGLKSRPIWSGSVVMSR